MAWYRQGDQPLYEPMMAYFALIYMRYFSEIMKFAYVKNALEHLYIMPLYLG